MDAICGWCGITRQAHYQKLRRQQERAKIEETILAKVRTIRQHHPRMGGRKRECQEHCVIRLII